MNADGRDDVVWGVGDIAKVIARTERATFHLLAKGQLPARKVGNRWVASRSKLIAHLLGDAAGADARAAA